MKYLYYYIWLIKAYISFNFIRKPITFIFDSFIIRLFPKKLREKRNQNKKLFKKEMNQFFLDFPDGISHWFVFGWVLIIFLAIFFMIPYIIFLDFISQYLNSRLTLIPVLSLLGAIPWYLIYVKKSNKEWLKKKIDKKKKDFYL